MCGGGKIKNLINEKFNWTNFYKKMFLMDVGKDMFEYFCSIKSDYCVIDMACCRFDIYSFLHGGFLTKNLSLKHLDKIVRNEEFFYPVNQLIIDDEQIMLLLEKGVPEYLDKLLEVYPVNRIVLVETKPLESYLGKDQRLHLFPRPNNTPSWKRRMDCGYEIARKHLPGCHIIEFPENNAANQDHKWGLGRLHYLYEYYDYALNCMDVITEDMPLDMERSRLLGLKTNCSKRLESIRNGAMIMDVQSARTQKINEQDIEYRIRNITDMNEYLREINKLENHYIIILMAGTLGLKISEDIITGLNQLGFCTLQQKAEVIDKRYRGYIAVRNPEKKVIFEEWAANDWEQVHYELNAGDFVYALGSAPWKNGSYARVIKDGVNYAMDQRGFNIVILDREGYLVHTAEFDTNVLPYTYAARKPIYYIDRKYIEEARGKPKRYEERCSRMYEKLLSSQLVLLGDYYTVKNFVDSYHHILHIEKVLIDNTRFLYLESGEESWQIEPYSLDKINKENQFIILCASEVKYRYYRGLLLKDEFRFEENFINVRLASAIIENKKIITACSYCQMSDLVRLFNRYHEISKDYEFFSYNQSIALDFRNTGSYLFADAAVISQYSAGYIYTPVFVPEKCDGSVFLPYLAENTLIFRLQSIHFLALKPYVSKQYSNNNILRERNEFYFCLPFRYREDCLDSLIVEGFSNEEIFNIASEDDFFSEEEIKKTFKKACLSLKVEESKGNLKMYHFIIDNYKKQRLYMDGRHWAVPLFYEVAKQIAVFFNMCPIDSAESITKNAVDYSLERDYIENLKASSEDPVYPCVAKVLQIEYATEDYKYDIVLGDGKTVQKVTFKEWIYMYCDCVRAGIVYKKYLMHTVYGGEYEKRLISHYNPLNSQLHVNKESEIFDEKTDELRTNIIALIHELEVHREELEKRKESINQRNMLIAKVAEKEKQIEDLREEIAELKQILNK